METNSEELKRKNVGEKENLKILNVDDLKVIVGGDK